MSGERMLFQRGSAGFDREMWDDSELIAAWNRQLAGGDRAKELTAAQEAHAAKAAASGDTPDSVEDDIAEESSEGSSDGTPPPRKAARVEVAPGATPPLPSWADERTARLLRAWFNAGYWQGVAAAASA